VVNGAHGVTRPTGTQDSVKVRGRKGQFEAALLKTIFEVVERGCPSRSTFHHAKIFGIS